MRFRTSVLFVSCRTFASRPYGPLMALFLGLSSPAVPQTTPDQVTIHTETPVVLLNVVVKDKHGRPVFLFSPASVSQYILIQSKGDTRRL